MSAQGQDGRSDAATRRIAGVVSAVVAACLLVVGLAPSGATQAAWRDEATVALPTVTVAASAETSDLRCLGRYRDAYVVYWHSTEDRRWTVTADKRLWDWFGPNFTVDRGVHHWAVVSTGDPRTIVVRGTADGTADVELKLAGGCPDWIWRHEPEARMVMAQASSTDVVPVQIHEAMEAYRAEIEGSEAPAEEEAPTGDEAEVRDDVIEPQRATEDRPGTAADAPVPTEDATLTVIPPAQVVLAPDGVINDEPVAVEVAP